MTPAPQARNRPRRVRRVPPGPPRPPPLCLALLPRPAASTGVRPRLLVPLTGARLRLGRSSPRTPCLDLRHRWSRPNVGTLHASSNTSEKLSRLKRRPEPRKGCPVCAVLVRSPPGTGGRCPAGPSSAAGVHRLPGRRTRTGRRSRARAGHAGRRRCGRRDLPGAAGPVQRGDDVRLGRLAGERAGVRGQFDGLRPRPDRHEPHLAAPADEDLQVAVPEEAGPAPAPEHLPGLTGGRGDVVPGRVDVDGPRRAVRATEASSSVSITGGASQQVRAAVQPYRPRGGRHPPRGREGYGASIRSTGGTETVRAPGVPARTTLRRETLFLWSVSWRRLAGLAMTWMW